MRASTAFFVGIGTVGLAIMAGLGGGLLVGNMMSPLPPKHAAAAARVEQPTRPQPMSAASALAYTAATLAFTDPAIDGNAPPAGEQVNAASSSAATAGVAQNDQAAKPTDGAAAQPTQDARPITAAPQASAPEDAYAKARDSDLKHEAEKRRADRTRRFSDRHLREDNQSFDQQARDDRNGDAGDRPSSYSYYHSDRRYRGATRGGDDREPRYYVDEAPRYGFPRIQLFGPDD
jgi:hypothetical protein